MSRLSACAFRNRAAGGAFRIAWDAACQLSRCRLADEVMSRALNGTVEVIRENGAVVAERRRFDNRFTIAVLTRLDRICESQTEENRAARLAADEFDHFVDISARSALARARTTINFINFVRKSRQKLNKIFGSLRYANPRVRRKSGDFSFRNTVLFAPNPASLTRLAPCAKASRPLCCTREALS
jgi:hypothetical protein